MPSENYLVKPKLTKEKQIVLIYNDAMIFISLLPSLRSRKLSCQRLTLYVYLSSITLRDGILKDFKW